MATKEPVTKALTLPTKQIIPLVETAHTVVVTNEEEKHAASIVLSNLNTMLDKVVAYKENKTIPLNQALKVIRAETKPFETQLEEGIAHIRKQMTTYQTEQTRIAQEKQDKIAARIGPGKGKIGVDTAVKQMEEVEKPSTEIETSAGSVDFIEVACFEVVDLSLVPLEYHLANEVSIRKAMKSGQELPGIRYWKEQRPRNFR